MVSACLHYDSLTIIYQTENREQKLRILTVFNRYNIWGDSLKDLFFTVNDINIGSYADDNTPYMIPDNKDDLITSLEQASNGLIEWFKNNFLKSNADKCYLLVSTNDRVSMNVDGFKIDKSDTEKLLGVKFAKKLIFYDHISDLCKKAGRKISALTRVTSYLGTGKKHILMNIFFTSQFSNCPLV